MRIKSRFLGLIFIAAVIVPSILLAVLSIRAAGREEAFVEKQLATTLLAEVTQTAGLANAEIGRIVDELRAGIEVPTGGEYAPALRQWQKSSPLVGVPFLLSPRYGILWPRADNAASDAERRFLRENGDFLSDKTATTVLQNIALRYRQEILAETRRAEEKEKTRSATPQKALKAQKVQSAVRGGSRGAEAGRGPCAKRGCPGLRYRLPPDGTRCICAKPRNPEQGLRGGARAGGSREPARRPAALEDVAECGARPVDVSRNCRGRIGAGWCRLGRNCRGRLGCGRV